MHSRHWSHIVVLVAVSACTDTPTSAPAVDPLFAKSTTQRADFTIIDTGSLVGDGNGAYVDGVCGVFGSWTTNVTHLAPAGTRVPKSQQASCTGIAPRAATLTLAVRHLSDSPHVDDASSPIGSFPVTDVKFGWGSAQATTVNASPSCGTAGLRFTSATYPGTDNVVRQDLGGGMWHMYTNAWPDNRAYCEVNGQATYWHVDLDIYVQVH